MPSVSIAAVKFARPGRASGLASLPDRTIEVGRHHRKAWPLGQDHRQSVRQLERLGRRDLHRPRRAAFGGSLRHGSSALIRRGALGRRSRLRRALRALRRRRFRRQLLLARDRLHDDAVLVLQVLRGEVLDRRRP